MKITDIEVIPIAMPLAKRYDNHHGARVCMISISMWWSKSIRITA